MTVLKLKEELRLNTVTMPEGEKKISGCYIGDLLSWVMGKAEAGDVWITIMSNINVVAVATLCDTACVLLAEGVEVDEEVKRTAEEKKVNILSSDLSAYALANKISELLV